MTTKSSTPCYPYARLKAMDEIMEFVRSPKWRPQLINVELLKLLNIAPSKEQPVVSTFKFLGLINSNGEPTDKFDYLKRDYQGTLKSIIEEKYLDVFSTIPEDLIDQARIVNFFMSKVGTSRDTAEYQGMLFGWLCRQAGISLPKLPSNFKRARFEKNKK